MSEGGQKRKAESYPEGARPAKKSNVSPQLPSDDRTLSSSDTVQVPQRPVAQDALLYSSWERASFDEKPIIYMNREFDGMVNIQTPERKILFRAPYRTTDDCVYTSDVLGHFSTPSGFVVARVMTRFTPWQSADKSTDKSAPQPSSGEKRS